jgi:hypothetical protein
MLLVVGFALLVAGFLTRRMAVPRLMESLPRMGAAGSVARPQTNAYNPLPSEAAPALSAKTARPAATSARASASKSSPGISERLSDDDRRVLNDLLRGRTE